MGYLAKKSSEKKAASATGPLGFEVDPTTWRTTGRVRAAAIVREAALSLKLKNRYSNINKTGRQNMIAGGIAGALTSVDTALWMRETGPKSWQIWIGAASVDGRVSMDWQCEVEVHANAVEIRTPHYFMRDGTIVHVKLHDEFRRTVFERMAIGTTREPGDSLALSQRVLTAAGVHDLVEPLGHCVDEFHVNSMVPFEELAVDFINGGFGFPRIKFGRFRVLCG